MYRVVLVLMVCMPLACSGSSKQEKAENALKPFQGKWIILRAQEGQEEIDAKVFAKFPVTFDGDQMEMIHEGQKMVKHTVRIRPNANPKEIDAQSPSTINEGKLLRGIYKFEDEKLTIAFGLNKESTRPSQFVAGVEGEKVLVMVLRLEN